MMLSLTAGWMLTSTGSILTGDNRCRFQRCELYVDGQPISLDQFAVSRIQANTSFLQLAARIFNPSANAVRRTSRMRLPLCRLGKTERTKSFGSLASPPPTPRITQLRPIEAETRLSIGALSPDYRPFWKVHRYGAI